MTDTSVATILSRLDRLEADVLSRFVKVEERFTQVDQRLMRIEAKIDEKPGHAEVWRTSATLTAFAVALIGGTVAFLKSIGTF